MHGVSRWFFITAVLSILTGMSWGILMSATQDHSLSPAHGHLNLIGWVTMAIFAFYYHVVPQAARGWVPKLHFALALAGLVTIVPGIAIVLSGNGDVLAKLGSVLTLASMVVFAFVVFTRSGAAKQ